MLKNDRRTMKDADANAKGVRMMCPHMPRELEHDRWKLDRFEPSVLGIFPHDIIQGNLDGLKRNMSRGNSLSDELDLSSVLGDARAYLYCPVWG